MVAFKLLLGRRGLGPGIRDEFEVLEALRAERLSRRGDDPVELAIPGVGDRIEDALCQGRGILRDRGRNLRDQIDRLAHDVADGAVAVVGPLVNARGQLQERPEQLERRVGIVRGDRSLDHAQQRLEIADERLLFAPIDKARCAAQGGEALAQIGGNLFRALRRAQFHPRATLQRGTPLHEIHDQRGEFFRAQFFKVGLVQGLLRHDGGSDRAFILPSQNV